VRHRVWRRGGGRRRRKRRAVRLGLFFAKGRRSVGMGWPCGLCGQGKTAGALTRAALEGVPCARSRLCRPGTTRRRPTPVHAAVRDRTRPSAPVGGGSGARDLYAPVVAQTTDEPVGWIESGDAHVPLGTRMGVHARAASPLRLRREDDPSKLRRVLQTSPARPTQLSTVAIARC
jgi:hypothetical protein